MAAAAQREAMLRTWTPRGLECLCGNLRMAARAATAAYDRHLSASGVQASQMAVLWAVAAAPPGPVRQLAAALAMDETTLSRSLRALAGAGWVRLEVGADRRCRVPVLTPAGRRVFAAALPHWQRAQAEAVRALGPAGGDPARQMLRWARALS